MESGIAKGLLAAAVGVFVFAIFRMTKIVNLDVDDGTKFLFGLAGALGLVSLFQGRLTKIELPGGVSAEFSALKQAVEVAVANTERLSERQDELAAPKMNVQAPSPHETSGLETFSVDTMTDLNKGKFGGDPASNGLVLKADVIESHIRSGWFRIDLRVEPEKTRRLDVPVTFYLHESYGDARFQVVNPVEGVARLTVLAWGAFTVGAVTDGGKTKLELDLSEGDNFPSVFRGR